MAASAPRVRTVLLRDFTTLRVGGEAELWEVNDEAQLKEATSEPFLVLGSGANLFVSDAGVDRRVVRLGRAYNDMAGFGADATVWVGAATPLPGMVRRAQRAGLSGLEGLSGVPAVLGGAIAMNAGTRFGEMSDSVAEVELFVNGALEVVPAGALGFRYRHSELPEGAVVTRARLELTPSSPEAVARTMNAVDAARAGQPKIKSAGCAFKNPPGDSAGRLIDVAGLKGLTVGDAMVAHEHGNFIINLGNASSDDVAALIALVQERLQQPLELEWRLWGF
ncbi:MAG: UDP-N-acetylmuramate dehydrogenase [Trueperaceae bacterium]